MGKNHGRHAKRNHYALSIEKAAKSQNTNPTTRSIRNPYRSKLYDVPQSKTEPNDANLHA
jgi:hypothetical protein